MNQPKPALPGAPSQDCLWWDTLSCVCQLPAPEASYTKKTADLCRSFLRGAMDRLGCLLVSAWSVDPVRRKLILAHVEGLDRQDVSTPVLDYTHSLSGTTVERKRLTRFDCLSKPDAHGRRFSRPDLAERLGLTQMISIPLLNSSNFNQVLMVLNLFPRPDAPLLRLTDEHLDRMAERLTAQIEAALRERCDRFANRLAIELQAVRKRTPDRLCASVAKLVRRAVDCDRVEIFLETADARGIKLQGADEAAPPAGGPLPTKELAEQSWRRNRELLSAGVGGAAPFTVPCGGVSAASVPLRDADGQAKGVVCCANRGRDTGGAPQPFTYDEVALIEAIGRAFVPQLEILMAEQRRVASLDRLVHELRVPFGAFRAVLERMQRECKEKNVQFNHNYFDEMWIYTNIMHRQLVEVDMLRTLALRIVLDPRPIYLENSIFAPAKRFSKPLLKKRDFDPNQLTFNGLGGFRLWLDPGLMTQVVFNLIENAVKYYQGAPSHFRLEIEGDAGPEGYFITFRDWGIGVPDGLEKRIFESGFRGPNATQYHVSGEGIGLWLARAIVRQHGGELTLERNREPTEFLVRLPRALAHGAPPEPRGDEEET
jgi:signal transduction histidine kinase